MNGRNLNSYMQAMARLFKFKQTVRHKKRFNKTKTKGINNEND